MGGIECRPVCAELTYGPERLVLMLNRQNSIWEDLPWNETLKYRDVEFDQEMQNNVYNFEVASTEFLFKLFEMYEAESKRVIETPVWWDQERGILSAECGVQSAEGPHSSLSTQHSALVYPAFDLALKCSHVFTCWMLAARSRSPREPPTSTNTDPG